VLGVGQGRATTGMVVPLQARAVLRFWCFGVCKAWPGTGRASLLAFWAQNIFFSVFLNLARTIKQLKTTKNRQKAIKCVGCLPLSARLESLA